MIILSGRIRRLLISSCRWRIPPSALHVRGPRFEPNDIFLLQLKLGRIFNRDQPLAFGDKAGKDVQKTGLAGAGSA